MLFPSLSFYDLTESSGKRRLRAYLDRRLPPTIEIPSTPLGRLVIDSVLEPLRYDVRAVIVEDPYVDRDYLSAYDLRYRHLTDNPPSTTTRLHFFDEVVGPTDVEQGKIPSRSYIGNVVLWPRRIGIAGRTLLRPPRDLHGMSIPTATFPVNLAGVRLSVDAVPFAQKDRVTAACASAALWVCMQLLAERHKYQSFPIAEITRRAVGGDLRDPVRSIPEGLTNSEMRRVLIEAGYSPALFDYNTEAKYRSAMLYGFAASGFPVIVMFEILTIQGEQIEGRARHAVTVVGLATNPSRPNGRDEVTSAASLVLHYLVHDDRGTPYQKLMFDAESGFVRLETASGQELMTGYDVDVMVPRPRHIDTHPAEAHNRGEFLRKWVQDSIKLASSGAVRGQGVLSTQVWASNDLKESLRRDNPRSLAAVAISGLPMPRWVWVTARRDTNDRCSDLIVVDATHPPRPVSFIAIHHAPHMFFYDAVDLRRSLQSGLQDTSYPTRLVLHDAGAHA